MFELDDRIFLGEGLFETLKIVNGEPSCAYLHWQRLSCSANQLSIPFELSYEHWLEQLVQKIKEDKIIHGGIKALLSGGSAPRGLEAKGQRSQLRLDTFHYTIQTQPLRLIRAPWLRDAANPVYQVKSINYLEAVLARRQALAVDANDALFFNTQHHATETTCANLFIIKNNTLLTPALTDGALPGITRSRILDASWQQHIDCQERSLSAALIETADAVFVTNSLQGIRNVFSLDEMTFALDHPLLARLESLLSV
ncbi:MAG: aminotransferase class IV [Legionella sp.]|nr:aminotransferase class IV [Legionella sp.]